MRTSFIRIIIHHLTLVSLAVVSTAVAGEGTKIFEYDFTRAGEQGSVDAVAGHPSPESLTWTAPTIALQEDGLAFSRDNLGLASVLGSESTRIDWPQAGGFRLRFKFLIQEFEESRSARPIVARYAPKGDDRSWAVWLQQNQPLARLAFLLSENGKDVVVLFTPEKGLAVGKEHEVVAEWIPGQTMRITVDGSPTDLPPGRAVPAKLHPTKEPITIGGARGVGFLKSAVIRSVSLETVEPLKPSAP